MFQLTKTLRAFGINGYLIHEHSALIPLMIIILLCFVTILVELIVGLYSSIFHLMADALHNILNVLALVFSLSSIIWGKEKNNSRFTYGFSRLEVIASFTNCCFLSFLALFLVFRSIHDSLEDLGESEHHGHSERGHEQLIIFITFRLFIYLVGTYQFAEYSGFLKSEKAFSKEMRGYNTHYSKNKKQDATLSSDAMNYYTLYLNFKLNMLHCLGFLVIEYIQFIRDLKGELILAILMFVYTISQTKFIFGLSTEILLQGLPNLNDIDLNKAINQIQKIPNIVRVDQTHYWAATPQYFIFSSNIIITDFQFKAHIEEAINNILTSYFQEIIIDFDTEH